LSNVLFMLFTSQICCPFDNVVKELAPFYTFPNGNGDNRHDAIVITQRAIHVYGFLNI